MVLSILTLICTFLNFLGLEIFFSALLEPLVKAVPNKEKYKGGLYEEK